MNWMRIGLLFTALVCPAVQAQSLQGAHFYQVPAHLQLATHLNDDLQTPPPLSMDLDLYYVASSNTTLRYFVGGALGTLIGFGTGHAVNGTWQEIGRVFTFGELLGFASATTGLFITGFDLDAGSSIGTALIFNGLGAYYILRIWEVGDVWLRPLIKGYVAHSGTSRMALTPMISPDTQGLGLTAHF